MTKSLTENTWVYTDKGIENVHWCNVDGVDELVTPKGKVLAPVPSYDEIKRLQKQLNEANVVIKWYDGLEKMLIGWELCTGQKKGTAEKYLEKWGVK